MQTRPVAGDPWSPGVSPSERDKLRPGRPAVTGQRDALQRGAAKRDPRRLPQRGITAPQPPLSQPAAAAPRPPGPRRLRGCWSGRWSRARGGRAGGKVQRLGSSRSWPGSPGGLLGVSGVPFRAGRVCHAARGRRYDLLALPSPRSPGSSCGRGGWCGARPPAVLPAGAVGNCSGWRLGATGLRGCSAPEGAAPSRRGLPGRVPADAARRGHLGFTSLSSSL